MPGDQFTPVEFIQMGAYTIRTLSAVPHEDNEGRLDFCGRVVQPIAEPEEAYVETF